MFFLSAVILSNVCFYFYFCFCCCGLVIIFEISFQILFDRTRREAKGNRIRLIRAENKRKEKSFFFQNFTNKFLPPWNKTSITKFTDRWSFWQRLFLLVSLSFLFLFSFSFIFFYKLVFLYLLLGKRKITHKHETLNEKEGLNIRNFTLKSKRHNKKFLYLILNYFVSNKIAIIFVSWSVHV